MRIFICFSIIYLAISVGNIFCQTIDLENKGQISQGFSTYYFPEGNAIRLYGDLPIRENTESIDKQIFLQNIIVDSVKCIVFTDFINIPEGMEQFKNVEKIIFENSTFDFPQNLFQKLETVEVSFGEIIGLELFEGNEWWLDKVKKISLGNASRLNLEFFHLVPNLEYIDFFEVTVDSFPSNIHLLRKLKEIRLIYFAVYQKFNLSQIDLNNYPNLQEFAFKASSNNFYSIPKSINNCTDCIIRIQHSNLTSKEKILYGFKENEYP